MYSARIAETVQYIRVFVETGHFLAALEGGAVVTNICPRTVAHVRAEIYRCLLSPNHDRVMLQGQLDPYGKSRTSEVYRECLPRLTIFPLDSECSSSPRNQAPALIRGSRMREEDRYQMAMTGAPA